MGFADSITKNKALKDFLGDKKELERPVSYIDTSVKSLNIFYSGKLDGGIVKEKFSTIAGESATGKSLLGLSLARNAIYKENMNVVYIDTEKAINKSTLENFQLYKYLDDKLVIYRQNNIVDVKKIIVNINESLSYEEKKNTLLILDSWGGLDSNKVYEDAMTGKDVTDMQKPKLLNQVAGILNTISPITRFVTAHTYDTMSLYPTKVIKGGHNLEFFSDSIVMMTSKTKDKKDDKDKKGTINNDIDGVILTGRIYKSRFAKKWSTLKFNIKNNGLVHPTFGLLDDAIESGVVVVPKQGYYSRSIVKDDKMWRQKQIWRDYVEFWKPIIESKSFKDFIKEKYTLSPIKFVDFDNTDDSLDVKKTKKSEVKTEVK